MSSPIALEHIDQSTSRLRVLTCELSRIRGLLESRQFGSFDSVTRLMVLRRLDAALSQATLLPKQLLALRGEVSAASLSAAGRAVLFARFEVIFDQLSRLEEVLDVVSEVVWQRHLLADASEYTTGSHASYTDSPRNFLAVDAVAASILVQLFGSRVIQKLEREECAWMPIALSGNNYSVGPMLGTIRLPRADLHRSRLWPLLAHELSHCRYRSCMMYQRLVPTWCCREVYTATPHVHEDHFRFSGYPVANSKLTEIKQVLWKIDIECERISSSMTLSGMPNLDLQAQELVCDVMATIVAGPSVLLAFLAHVPLTIPDRSKPASVAEAARPAVHPPVFFRIRVMYEVLRSLKCDHLIDKSQLREYLAMYLSAIRLPRDFSRAIGIWSKYVDQLAKMVESLARVLLPVDSENFGPERLTHADNVTDFASGIGIAEILTRGWIKRQRVETSIRDHMRSNQSNAENVSRLFGGASPIPSTLPSITDAILVCHDKFLDSLPISKEI